MKQTNKEFKTETNCRRDGKRGRMKRWESKIERVSKEKRHKKRVRQKKEGRYYEEGRETLIYNVKDGAKKK